jgi:hypothetical protein
LGLNGLLALVAAEVVVGAMDVCIGLWGFE